MSTKITNAGTPNGAPIKLGDLTEQEDRRDREDRNGRPRCKRRDP